MWLNNCKKKSISPTTTRPVVASMPTRAIVLADCVALTFSRNNLPTNQLKASLSTTNNVERPKPEEEKMQTSVKGSGDKYCRCNPALFFQPHKPNEAGLGGAWTERVVVKIVQQKRLYHNINHKHPVKIYCSFYIYKPTVSSFKSLFSPATNAQSNSRPYFHGN